MRMPLVAVVGVVMVLGGSAARADASPDVTAKLDAKAMGRLDVAELRFLRNEIYARHGRKFSSASLNAVFSRQAWYKPADDYSDDKLSQAEKDNLSLLSTLEKKKGGALGEPAYVEWMGKTLEKLIPEGMVLVRREGKSWVVQLTCGEPSVSLQVQRDKTVSIVALASDSPDTTEVAALRRDGNAWLVFPGTRDPLRLVSGSDFVEWEGDRYMDPSGLATNETIKGGCSGL